MRDFEEHLSKELSEKAEELLDLYNAGRIVVLPCIPGSTIYKVKEQSNGKRIIEPYCMGLSQIVDNLSLFGELYFTDLEDAKKFTSTGQNKE